jgi:hypothetical protein
MNMSKTLLLLLTSCSVINLSAQPMQVDSLKSLVALEFYYLSLDENLVKSFRSGKRQEILKKEMDG